jgi:large subunit ribosomal protein L25
MNKRFQLKAKTRTDSNNQALRRSGAVPAILYGSGLDSQAIQINQKTFLKLFKETGYTSLVHLTIEGSSKDKTEKTNEHTVLIREVQFHPLKNNTLHVDFFQVDMNKTIRTQVPLSFIGEAPAVKDMGGVLIRSHDTVDLEALPNDLPHDIEVDISILDDFEKIIHIKDLTLPDGVKLHHEQDDVITLVQPPRTEEELEKLTEETEEDVEGVEGVKDEEGEEEETTEGETKEEATGPEDATQQKEPESSE